MARIEKYLAIGSKIVLVRNGTTKPIWYTTQKDVILEEPVKDNTCPLTAQPVLTATVSGVRVWFKHNMIRTRVIIEAGDVQPDYADHQLSMIDYDIPAVSGYSPVSALYQVAVPMTESVWLVRTGDMSRVYPIIAAMQDRGAKVDVTRLDPTETKSKTARAIGFLLGKLTEAIENAAASMQRANDKLARSEDEGVSQKNAEAAYMKQIAVIEKRLEKMRADVEKGAKSFGVTLNAWNPTRLTNTARDIRSEMTKRVRAYTRATVALGAAGTTTTAALAVAATNGNVLPEVMADALREAGDEAGANELQQAFSEDDTFSLNTDD